MTIEERQTYIGGSDISSLCGVGTLTPLELFLEKKGELQRTSTFDMSVGKRLEPVIRDLYLDYAHSGSRKGWLFNDYEVTHPTFPFLKGHLDGFHPKTNTILECKSARFSPLGFPLRYHLQVAFYCALTEAECADVAILFNTHDFKIYTYQRNRKLEALLLQKAQNFWEALQCNQAPPIQQACDIRRQNDRLYGALEERPLAVTPSLLTFLNHYREAQEKSDEAKKTAEHYKLELVKGIEKYDKMIDEFGNEMLTYRFDQKGREIADLSKLKKEYPEVWEKVKKVIPPSRRLILR